jgi:hypothetical protein
MKIIVYGKPSMEKRTLARQLYLDNDDFQEPVEITSRPEMQMFLADPQPGVGFISADSLTEVKVRFGVTLEFSNVVFVPCPAMLVPEAQEFTMQTARRRA